MKTALLVLLPLSLLACSGEDRPPASNITASSSSGGVGITNDGGADAADAEAGLPRENDALCMGLPAPPRVIAEYLEPMTTPAAYGGTIMPGLYELDELDVYDPTGGADGGEGPVETTSGKSGSGTLTITTNTMAFNDSYGPTDAVPAVAARGYAYSFSGTTVYAAQTCPTTATTEEIPFSVSGSTISLFTDATHRVLYRLKPD